MRELVEVLRESLALGNDVLAHAQQIGEVAGERVGLCPHFRDYGAERDGGAQRLQRILRPHQERGRRLPPDALEGGENLDDHGAALVERFLKNVFPLVERLETGLCRIDLRLDVAHARGRVR